KYVKYNHRKYVYLLHKKYDEIDIFNSESSEAIPNVTEHSIDHLIDRGICICGEELTHEHIYTLEEQKKHQPPISNEGYISAYKTEVEKESGFIDDLINDIRKLIDTFHEKQSDLDEAEQELISIDKIITKSSQQKVRELNKRRAELLDNKTTIGIDINNLEKSLRLLSDELKVAKNKYYSMRDRKSDSDLFIIKSEILHASIYKLEQHRDISKGKLRVEIENVANQHFSEIITKDKKIIIDKNFVHKVVDKNGDEAAT